MKATRVMKARRPGSCVLRRGPIHVGQQIAKTGIWAHVQCVIEKAITLTERTTP
jgi:hypothetical protein